MENRKFTINIKIDGKAYPLKINREDEERYRLAAKKVNEMVLKFRAQFGDQEGKDLLAMTAFQIALSHTEVPQTVSKTLFIDELKNVNDDISDFLKDKNKK